LIAAVLTPCIILKGYQLNLPERSMRTCNRHFPGTDSKISDQMALDVANDEKAIIDAIALLRQNDASSLEWSE
jgi:hypothetical protein